MKAPGLILISALCFSSAPATATEFSWDPLTDVENVLLAGAPNEGKIIQARHQVGEMAQDALAALYEMQPGARRAIERSAGYAMFSTYGIKRFFAGGQGGMFLGAAAVAPGVYLHQLTDTGLSATLTVPVTRFFKDADLN